MGKTQQISSNTNNKSMALSLMTSPISFFDQAEDAFLSPFSQHLRVMRPLHAQLHSQPCLDLIENESSYTVTVDVPGMSKDDLELSIDDGCLNISGKRSTDEQEETDNCRIHERRHFNFSRSLRLPKDAGTKSEDVTAAHKDGVLAVTFLKTAPSKRSINIQ